MVRRPASLLLLLALIAACGTGSDGMQDDVCVNRALTAVLTVDHDDPRAVWATNAATGQVIALRLPEGYGVTPLDQVVNAEGRVVAESGDVIDGGCSDLLQDALLIDESNIRPAP